MILYKGRESVPLPIAGQFLDAHFFYNGVSYAIQQVSRLDMSRVHQTDGIHGALRGAPTMVCVDKKRAYFWPPADKKYAIKLRLVVEL